MARVLFLSLVFPPDGVSTARIVGELALDLHAAGHDVTVLSTAPHYNRDVEAEQAQPITPVWGPLLGRSRFGGVHVYHTFMPRKGRSIALRLAAWAGFHLLALVAAARFVRRVDVIFAPSPPLTIGVFSWLLARAYHAPSIYNVQELYPDVAISLGALRNRRLIRLLRWLESFVYSRATAVTAIAPVMGRRLLERGVPAGKVHVIPNFVDVVDLQPLDRHNEFADEQGFGSDMVVSYAGNIGPAQGLSAVIEAAAILREEPGILFAIIGDGTDRERLVARASALGLANVRFVPFQPYSRVPQIYAASDMCLVAQAPGTSFDAVPSKVYRIMACARPVLALTDRGSDTAELLAAARCGVSVAPGDASALASVVRSARLERGRWASMGEAGRSAVLDHYSRATISARYDRLVRDLLSGRGGA